MEELLDSFAVPDLSPRPRTIPENQDVVAEEDEAFAVEDDDPDVDAAAAAAAAAEEEENERDIFGERLCVAVSDFVFETMKNFRDWITRAGMRVGGRSRWNTCRTFEVLIGSQFVVLNVCIVTSKYIISLNLN